MPHKVLELLFSCDIYMNNVMFQLAVKISPDSNITQNNNWLEYIQSLILGASLSFMNAEFIITQLKFDWVDKCLLLVSREAFHIVICILHVIKYDGVIIHVYLSRVMWMYDRTLNKSVLHGNWLVSYVHQHLK